MLRFFRINDPYRLVVVFILLLLWRIPILMSDSLLTVPELAYMVLGEKLTSGAMLYSEVWDNSAPLFAFVVNGIDYIFGRSQLAYQLLAYAILCFQVFIFNSFLIETKAFAENTYLPALIFGLLASIYFDMVTFTPFLFALTFILLALKNIFSHVEMRAKRDEHIFNIGLYLGLATIIYLPFVIFFVATILIFLLFTGTVARRYGLLFFGFLLPLLISGSYFLLTQRFEDFLYCFLSPFLVIGKTMYVPYLDVLFLFGIPTLFFVLAFFRMIQGARLTNFQSRLTQAMFVWFLFSVIFVFLADQNSPNVYIVFVPILAFYLTHYYLFFRRKLWAELSFILLIIGVAFTYFTSLSQIDWFERKYDQSAYIVDNQEYKSLEGYKIVVLSDDIRPYRYASLASPFFNWQLSDEVFYNLNYYDNLTLLHQGFIKDKPDIIIDKNKVMPAVFEKIPKLGEMYYQSADGYYRLRQVKL